MSEMVLNISENSPKNFARNMAKFLRHLITKYTSQVIGNATDYIETFLHYSSSILHTIEIYRVDHSSV